MRTAIKNLEKFDRVLRAGLSEWLQSKDFSTNDADALLKEVMKDFLKETQHAKNNWLSIKQVLQDVTTCRISDLNTKLSALNKPYEEARKKDSTVPVETIRKLEWVLQHNKGPLDIQVTILQSLQQVINNTVDSLDKDIQEKELEQQQRAQEKRSFSQKFKDGWSELRNKTLSLFDLKEAPKPAPDLIISIDKRSFSSKVKDGWSELWNKILNFFGFKETPKPAPDLIISVSESKFKELIANTASDLSLKDHDKEADVGKSPPESPACAHKLSDPEAFAVQEKSKGGRG